MLIMKKCQTYNVVQCSQCDIYYNIYIYIKYKLQTNICEACRPQKEHRVTCQASIQWLNHLTPQQGTDANIKPPLRAAVKVKTRCAEMEAQHSERTKTRADEQAAVAKAIECHGGLERPEHNRAWRNLRGGFDLQPVRNDMVLDCLICNADTESSSHVGVHILFFFVFCSSSSGQEELFCFFGVVFCAGVQCFPCLNHLGSGWDKFFAKDS